METKSIGDIIKSSRNAKNLSQQDLADILNVTRQAVSNWENNLSYPDQSLIVKLCKTLDINIRDIYGDKIDKDYHKLIHQEKIHNRHNIITLSIIIILIIVTTIFLLIKRNTNFYTLDISSEYFNLENAYYIYSNKDNYMNLGQITSPVFDLNQAKITIYYEYNKKEFVVYQSNYSDNTIIKLNNTTHIKQHLHELVLRINYNFRNTNYVDEIPINFTKQFTSSGLIKTKKSEDIPTSTQYKLDIELLAKHDYEYDPSDDTYHKQDKYLYIYYRNNNKFEISTNEFYAIKDYRKNTIRIGYQDQVDRYVTIYLNDSIIKYNNDIEIEYKTYLDILNKELVQIESN